MKLLIFDIDGTLTRLDGATRRAFDAAFLKLFNRRVAVEQLELPGRLDPLIIRDCFHLCGMADQFDEAFPRFREVYLEELPRSIAATPTARLNPGIRELLTALDQQHRDRAALALGTGNMEDGARIKVGFFGLNGFFPVGGFGDRHVQRCDVMREAVKAAETHYGRSFDPKATWVIGDTPFDIQGGQQCGLRTLAVATGTFSLPELVEAGADVALQDLSDTQTVLRVLGLE